MNTFQQDYDYAVVTVVNHQYVTQQLLQNKNHFSPARAQQMLNAMQDKGVIDTPSTKGFYKPLLDNMAA